MRNILVLYNTDYDPSPPPREVPGRDRSEVSRAAHDVYDGIRAHGLNSGIMGVCGADILQCMEKVRATNSDLIFNLTESLSQNSVNEAVMPVLLDMFGIPYTGSNALTLALCLHKPKSKEILRAHAIPTPESITVVRPRDVGDIQLPFPLFVKLSREDASIGVLNENVVTNKKSLHKRVKELLEEFGQPVLVERYIEGREIYVTLIGNDRLKALPFHEIDFSQMPEGKPPIVTYAAKWDEGSPEYAGTKPVPVRGLLPVLRTRLEQTAVQAFRVLELRDYGRIDFRVSGDGTPYVIDVNPNCDISPGAGVARAALVAGISYPQLLGRICELAWERTQHAHPKARAA